MSLRLRPEVAWFAKQMENRLREMERDGDAFEDCHNESLCHLLMGETIGLSDTLRRGKSTEVVTVALNVAGFAMKIAKNSSEPEDDSSVDED